MTELTGFAIAPEKLGNYPLDLDHPDGSSKARFFIARGFSRERPEELARALDEHAKQAAGTNLLIPGRSERRLVLVGPLACPNGSQPLVRSVWGYREDRRMAHLITAYPARRRRPD